MLYLSLFFSTHLPPSSPQRVCVPRLCRRAARTDETDKLTRKKRANHSSDVPFFSLCVQAANESAILDIEDEDDDSKKQKNAGAKVREPLRVCALRDDGCGLRDATGDKRRTPALRPLLLVLLLLLHHASAVRCCYSAVYLRGTWYSAGPLQCGATTVRSRRCLWADGACQLRTVLCLLLHCLGSVSGMTKYAS